MPAAYFDLDGTLIDVRRRHYAAYADTLHDLGLEPLTEPAYWERRRRGASSGGLLNGASDTARGRFLDGFIMRVEDSVYLTLDAVIHGAIEALESLRSSHALVLVTLRRERGALHEQLDRLDLSDRFDAVLSPARGDESKDELIRDAGALAAGSVVIGDSEADVEAARALGLRSICVTTGVRDRTFLRALAPDLLIDSVAELPGVLTSGLVGVRGVS